MKNKSRQLLLLAALFARVNGLTSNNGCTCSGDCNSNSYFLIQPTSGGNQNFCTTNSCGMFASNFWWDYCSPSAYIQNGDGLNCYLDWSCQNSCSSGSSCSNEALGNCISTPSGYNYACIAQWEQGNGGECYLDSSCLYTCGSGSTCSWAEAAAGGWAEAAAGGSAEEAAVGWAEEAMAGRAMAALAGVARARRAPADGRAARWLQASCLSSCLLAHQEAGLSLLSW